MIKEILWDGNPNAITLVTEDNREYLLFPGMSRLLGNGGMETISGFIFAEKIRVKTRYLDMTRQEDLIYEMKDFILWLNIWNI